MDTNVKKFKYSSLKKFLCIMLSLLTFSCSVWIVTNTVVSFAYIGDGKSASDDFTASQSFQNAFCHDIEGLEYDLASSHQNSVDKKKLTENRDDLIDKAYKEYLLINEQEEKNLSAFEGGYYDEDTYEWIEETTVYIDYDIHLSVPDTNYTLTLNYYEIDNSNDAKAQIGELIDNEISNLQDNFENSFFYHDKEEDTLRVCGEYKGFKTGNLRDGDTRESITSHGINFVIENGKFTSNGIDSETAGYFEKNCFSQYPDDMVIYGYIELNDKSDYASVLEMVKANDSYRGIEEYCPTAVSYYNNLNRNIIIAAVSLILSFFFAFRYLTVAGKRSAEEKSKLAFIDYVPVELHLGVWVGAGVVLFLGLVAFTSDMEEGSIIGLCVKLVLLYCIAVWLMLMEFCGSAARIIMGERKIYKAFLVFWIFYWLYLLFRLFFKGLRRLCRAVKRSAKKTAASIKNNSGIFTYKPKKFTKNIIVLSILFFAVNIILILAAVLFALFGWVIVTVIIALVFIAANVVIIREVCKYFKSLDMIIISAQNRQNLIADLDALPQSLKILAESMRYTNIELQNAINKAVKDERLRTELITNVSHDLKTPLTSIITYVDLLSKCNIDDPKAKEYIAVLDEKGARLKRLIDDLIEASKVTSGNVSVNLSPINLSELCLQSTVDVQSDFERGGLELVVKQGEKPTIVTADGAKAFRVIENLLSNAKKYSAKGSRVYISVYNSNGSGVFEIKNISAQPLDITPDELTERFVRGDKSRNQEGNGLGLSIAKELCRLQNGQLELFIDGDLFKAKAKFPLAARAVANEHLD